MTGNKQRHTSKKRYGLLLVFTLLNWLAVAAMVYFVDPDSIKDILFTNSYLPMMVLIFGGIFLLTSIIFMSARRALRWTLGIIIFIYLKIWEMGTAVNAFLIFGLLGSLELYLWKTKNQGHRVAESSEEG